MPLRAAVDSSARFYWRVIKERQPKVLSIIMILENPLHLPISAYCPQGKDEHILMVHQFKAYSEQGVVFNLFSASQQSILRRYPALVAMSILLWCMLYSAYMILILFVLSLIFAFMRVHNMRESVRENSLAYYLKMSSIFG